MKDDFRYVLSWTTDFIRRTDSALVEIEIMLGLGLSLAISPAITVLDVAN